MLIQFASKNLVKPELQAEVADSPYTLESSSDRMSNADAICFIGKLQGQPGWKADELPQLPNDTFSRNEFTYLTRQSEAPSADEFIHVNETSDAARFTAYVMQRQMDPRPPTLVCGIITVHEEVGNLSGAEPGNVDSRFEFDHMDYVFLVYRFCGRYSSCHYRKCIATADDHYAGSHNLHCACLTHVNSGGVQPTHGMIHYQGPVAR